MVFQSQWMAAQQPMDLNGRLGIGFTTRRMMGRKISIRTVFIWRVNSAMKELNTNSASRWTKMAEGGEKNVITVELIQKQTKFRI